MLWLPFPTAQEKIVADQSAQALNDLGVMAASLIKEANNAGEQAKIKAKILDLFGQLDTDTAKSLLKNDQVMGLLEVISDEQAQASADKPGTVRSGFIGQTKVNGFTKREWTEADLRKENQGAGKMVTFTPFETLPVFWNGLMRQFIAFEETTVEKCFYDIYQEHLKATVLGRDHARYLFRQQDTLRDPSMISPEGARARGMGEQGWYKAGGGSVLTRDNAGQSQPGNEQPGAQEGTP